MLRVAAYGLAIVASIALIWVSALGNLSIAGVQTGWMEALASVSGGWSVWLVVKENTWTWPVNVVSSVFTGIVYLQGKLWGNAWLQILFVLLSAFGLYMWLFGGKNRAQLPITYSRSLEFWVPMALGVVATYPLWRYFSTISDSSPFWDGLTFAFSLVGTYMQTRKLMENWPVWIVVNAIYIPLCVSLHWYLLAAISLVYLIMAVVGWIDWRKIYALEAAT